jgi:hypothetical protein
MPKAVAASRKSRADLAEHMASIGINLRPRAAKADGSEMSDDDGARGRSKSAKGKKRSYSSSVGPSVDQRCVRGGRVSPCLVVGL